MICIPPGEEIRHTFARGHLAKAHLVEGSFFIFFYTCDHDGCCVNGHVDVPGGHLLVEGRGERRGDLGEVQAHRLGRVTRGVFLQEVDGVIRHDGATGEPGHHRSQVDVSERTSQVYNVNLRGEVNANGLVLDWPHFDLPQIALTN